MMIIDYSHPINPKTHWMASSQGWGEVTDTEIRNTNKRWRMIFISILSLNHQPSYFTCSYKDGEGRFPKRKKNRGTGSRLFRPNMTPWWQTVRPLLLNGGLLEPKKREHGDLRDWRKDLSDPNSWLININNYKKWCKICLVTSPSL